jgi:hypothetical protein
MPKPSHSREPDPMASVVDRLLAQLPGLQQAPGSARTSFQPGSTSTFPGVTSTIVATPIRAPEVTPRQWIGVWGRVVLGLSLGITMAGWPYARACGFPLVGYLAAVLTVILTGIWAASAAWRYRLGLAHVVALLVLFYGFTLGAAELLPRTGYAVDRASWGCEEVNALSPAVVTLDSPSSASFTSGPSSGSQLR